ncbi:hypothetical protein PUN28_020688 [Cardiocondyla obscurior]|uniref:Uncharacterized protein n=1 Tax=Cardiocondyla obscurior TaxID=286306 RepID=A0AAW2E628_9HYME
MRRVPVVTYAAASSCAPGEEWRPTIRSRLYSRKVACVPLAARAGSKADPRRTASGAAVGRAWVTPRPELTGRHEALTKTSSREIGFGTRRAPQLRRCPDLPSDLENPGEGHVEVSRRFVPISAAGLQGKEPLVDRLM